MNRLTAAVAATLVAGAAVAQGASAPPASGAMPPSTPPHGTNPHGTNPHSTMPPVANPHGTMPPSALPAGATPRAAGAAGPRSGGMAALVRSDGNRLMVTCRIDALGNVPVLVNFVDRTALSTRSAGISPATIEGDVVRWQEKEPAGASKYTFNRRTGEIQVLVPAAGGEDTLRRGTCAPPGQAR